MYTHCLIVLILAYAGFALMTVYPHTMAKYCVSLRLINLEGLPTFKPPLTHSLITLAAQSGGFQQRKGHLAMKFALPAL